MGKHHGPGLDFFGPAHGPVVGPSLFGSLRLGKVIPIYNKEWVTWREELDFWPVGGLEHVFFQLGIIIPTDFQIFQRG